MAVAERIDIRELYEFQLYERGKDGDAVPVGEPRRSLERVVMYDDENHGVQPDQWYALRRRKITVDEDGYPQYGRWSKLTDWKRPNTSPID